MNNLEKAKHFAAELRKVVDEELHVPINDVPAPVRQQYAMWRQRAAAAAMWCDRFAKYAGYSSAINAAMALGKFGEYTAPEEVVDNSKASAIHNICSELWNAIQDRGMVPREEV